MRKKRNGHEKQYAQDRRRTSGRPDDRGLRGCDSRLRRGGAAVSAEPGQWANRDFTFTYDDPDWHGDVSDVDFEDSWEEGATNARSGGYYVFLKNDGKGDYSVEFDVKEDGLYEIDVCLMAWEKSVLRATNIKVDESDWIRLAFDYENEDKQLEQYITGLTINLKRERTNSPSDCRRILTIPR